MSTMTDVWNARQRYDEHGPCHGCRVGDGCPVRLRLWREYCGSSFSVAARWNEPELYWDI